MKPLIDGDMLLYEVGAMGQDEDGPRSWDYVETALRRRVDDICWMVGGKEAPAIYLTGEGNFRFDVAKAKPYKGNRKQEKPYHYLNIKAYLEAHYDTEVITGMEADDAMAIAQCNSIKAGHPHGTVICTRDKDLRMVPGWHYGWECGNCKEFELQWVTEEGQLHLDTSKKKPKLTGNGMAFFYSQLLTGDTVDNIPGVPRVGDVKAYALLGEAEDIDEMWELVKGMYEEKELTEEYMLEQAYLLWMVRELNDDGSPVMWQPPN